MKLDKTFESEIRKAGNGDGSREYRCAVLLPQLREASTALANRYGFASCVRTYGRAIVALCVASTIARYPYRFSSAQHEWATLVSGLWTNKHGNIVTEAVINIHAAILADNSRGMRQLTIISP